MLSIKSMALQGPGIVQEGLALVVSDKQGGRVLPVPELLWCFSASGPASPFLNCIYCGPPLERVVCSIASAIDGRFAWSEGSLGVCRIVLADVAMICTGLFGALSINNYRWGYYVISCLFFLIVLWGLVGPVAKVGCVLGNLPQRLLYICYLRLLLRLWLCLAFSALLGLGAKASYGGGICLLLHL